MAAAAEPSACVLYMIVNFIKDDISLNSSNLSRLEFKKKIPLLKLYFKTYLIFALDSGKNAIVIESRKESFYSFLK